MKKILLATALLFGTAATYAQSESLPTTMVKDLSSNDKIGFNETFKPGRVTMVNFWATWCVPCKKEIKNVRAKLDGWQKETEFDYMTVSLDESRAEGLVRSYAISQGWKFPYFIDPNSDLKRSLNFQNVPFTLIVGKDGKVAYMHSGYEEGGENEIYEKIKELAAL